MILKTPYGNETIREPVLIALIKSTSVQRLKKINQYGITAYVTDMPSFSRYDHSIGVMILLRKYKCSLEEQIAGLLHDVSHTVFSHVADSVFDHVSDNNSYQDDIHEWFINKTELPIILKKYGFCVKDILHKQKKFKALEQDLPNICADRLEYNLRGALVEKMIDKKEIINFLNALEFKNNKWFFTDITIAQKFAEISLYLQEYAYTSPLNCLTYHWTAELLKYALEQNIITYEEIHFSTDTCVLKKLQKSKDSNVIKLLEKIFKAVSSFKKAKPNNFDMKFTIKFRGIDPWIKKGKNLCLLSNYDKNFAKKYFTSQQITKNGWYVKFK